MDLEAALWSELPFEILEQVLSFVPVPDLCRYRTVCKAWNHLISDLRFARVHAQNASKRSDMMSFIVTRVRNFAISNSSFWSILDLNAKRWYKLTSTTYSSLVTTGMGGGLVCDYVEDLEGTKVKSITVPNPISHTTKVLPTAPIDHQSGELCLAIDTNTFDNFKVILFHRNVDMEHCFVMHVYDSATNEWKGMKQPTWIPTETGCILKHIIFQGSVYVLFKPEHNFDCHHLWRINLVEDVWEELYVPRGYMMLDHFDFIVSANRLFLGQMEDIAQTLFYIQTEIKVSERTKQMVVDRSKARYIEILGADQQFWNRRSTKAFSFGSSLIFMSETCGKMMSFDVVRGTWDREWPQNPLQQPTTFRTLLCMRSYSWREEHMNLLMPNCTI